MGEAWRSDVPGDNYIGPVTLTQRERGVQRLKSTTPYNSILRKLKALQIIS